MDGERVMAAPLVVFTSRPNSHPFQERHITCQEPVKIGRSVARAHPAPANAIFDCKVLSRNHALLWFEENKFYLQDTKSSNGTFVNNQRLSKGSEESDPHEVFSGDIIQFGVDVMENSKRVTHGCIMASITLYLPDGSEFKPRFSGGSQTSPHSISAVHSQEMYQLSQYLQEALHREQVLQDKMAHIQRLLHSNNESCESSWHALINEDRLLSKLEVLQNQLSVFSKNQTEGSLQQQIITMEEERLSYETSSKQSLRKVLEEKITAIQELSAVERSLANAEDECKHLTDLHEESQLQLSQLTDKYEKKLIEYDDITKKLQEAEQSREDDMIQYDRERGQLQAQLEEAMADKDSLQARIEHLETQIDEQTNKYLEVGDTESALLKQNGDHSSQDSPANDTNESQQELLESLKKELEEAQTKVLSYQDQIDNAEAQLKESEQEIKTLNHQLDQAQLEIVQYVTKVATLEERIKATLTTAGDVINVNESAQHLQDEIKALTEQNESTVRQLTDELERIKNSQICNEHSAQPDNKMVQDLKDKLTIETNLHTDSQRQLVLIKDELVIARKEMESQVLATVEYKDKTLALEERLQEISEQHKQHVLQSQEEKAAHEQHAEHSRKECDSLRSECSSLRMRIQAIEEELLKLQQDNSMLGNEVTKTKSHNEELADQISRLQESYDQLKLLNDSLHNRESSMKENLTDTQKEADHLKECLQLERQEHTKLLGKYDQSIDDLNQSKKELEEAQRLHSEAQQKLEELRSKLESVNDNYNQLADKSKTMTFCSTLPLMVLVLAVVLALYPFLSRVTSPS